MKYFRDFCVYLIFVDQFNGKRIISDDHTSTILNDEVHTEGKMLKAVVGHGHTPPIFGKEYEYSITDDGKWFIDPCMIIGDEEHGLVGTFLDMLEQSNQINNTDIRRLNPVPYIYTPTRKWTDGIIPVDRTGHSGIDNDKWNTMVSQYLEIGIQIIDRTDEVDYVKIIDGDGCYSFVGKTGGEQELSLGNGCHFLSTMIHEFGHALSMLHTQSRNDRNDFVTIQFDNIEDNVEYNFEIDNGPTCGCYDCGSVMHYSEYAFSKNGKKTIVPLDGETCNIQRNEVNPLSTQDIVCIKALYFDEPSSCSISTDSPTRTRNPTTPTIIPTNMPSNYPVLPPTMKPTNVPITSINRNDITINEFCLLNSNAGSESNLFFMHGGYLIHDIDSNGNYIYKLHDRISCDVNRHPKYIFKYSNSWFIHTNNYGNSDIAYYNARCNDMDNILDCSHNWEKAIQNQVDTQLEVLFGECPRLSCGALSVNSNFDNTPACSDTFWLQSDNIWVSAQQQYFAFNDYIGAWMCSDNLEQITGCSPVPETSEFVRFPTLNTGDQIEVIWGENPDQKVTILCENVGTRIPTSRPVINNQAVTSSKNRKYLSPLIIIIFVFYFFLFLL